LNPYTSEVAFQAGGESWTVQFNWTAIAAVQAEVGTEIFSIFEHGDFGVMAKVLAIGLKAHHPDMTVDKILTLSPPISRVQEALHDALVFAYWGPEGVPTTSETEPAQGGKKGKKKKET
jgi:hypothetical protein